MKFSLKRLFVWTAMPVLVISAFASPANASVASESSISYKEISVEEAHFPENIPTLEESTKNLTEEDQAAVLSGQPLTMVMDPKTGLIEEIDTTPQVSPYALVTKSNCSSVTACLYGGGVPYADYGFTSVGGGTAKGTWTHRVKYGSQTRPMSTCTIYACGAKVAPKQLVFYSSPTTVKSVTIY